MSNNWTKEEIALTRHAWYLHDMASYNKFERVCRWVSITTLIIVTTGVVYG